MEKCCCPTRDIVHSNLQGGAGKNAQRCVTTTNVQAAPYIKQKNHRACLALSRRPSSRSCRSMAMACRSLHSAWACSRLEGRRSTCGIRMWCSRVSFFGFKLEKGAKLVGRGAFQERAAAKNNGVVSKFLVDLCRAFIRVGSRLGLKSSKIRPKI